MHQLTTKLPLTAVPRTPLVPSNNHFETFVGPGLSSVSNKLTRTDGKTLWHNRTYCYTHVVDILWPLGNGIYPTCMYIRELCYHFWAFPDAMYFRPLLPIIS